MARFTIRIAQDSDLPQLVELEKEWPENARATQEQLKFRLDAFQQGYFIAEDETGIIASIICYHYDYHPEDLSNYQNWESVVTKCYESDPAKTNALYIIAGTCKPTPHGGEVFDGGVTHVAELAKKLGKKFVVGGCLLPGYARHLRKYGELSAADYVFKKSNHKWIDPLIEKYRKLGFHVPDKKHVLANYFLHEASCNYSALVVKHVEAND